MPTSSLEPIVRRLQASFHRGSTVAAPADALDPNFNALALDLFRVQCEHVEPYRRFCHALNRSPSEIMRWQEIPPVPTAAFKDFELTPLPPGEARHAVFHSSGTTEQRPSRHVHSKNSLAIYERSLLPWFRRHLLPEGGILRLLSLTPDNRKAPHSSLAHMLTTIGESGQTHSRVLGRVLTDGTWTVDTRGFVDEVQQAQKSGCALLVAGTALNFAELVDHLNTAGADGRLPPGSRLMETGGTKGRSQALSPADLYRRLTTTFGVPDSHIVSEYGMSELSSQAYDRVAGESGQRCFRFPPWCAHRILGPETGLDAPLGEPGILVVYDLANVGSVLAVQTEDLAIAHENGFTLAGRAPRAEPRGCSLMTA